LHSRLVGPYIGKLGTEEQKQRFLPGCASGERILGIAMTESGAGSDLAGMKTQARQEGDHWVLTGSKTFISNGINGDLFVVAARTVPDKRHGLGLFLVEGDMVGFERGRNLKKMGLKAQDTAELFFDKVKLPAVNVLGDPEKGFYNLMHFLVEERLINAVGSISHAQVAFDLTMDYIGERKAFGQSIAAFQNTRFKMADMGAEVIRVDRVAMPQESAKPGVQRAGAQKARDPLIRGRRSIALNLKSKAGIGALLRLIDQADALFEGFRPGVAERLGFGPEQCLERNPQLVFGRLTGWGQEGPLAQAAGHDINYIALSGALHSIGRRGRKPVAPLNLLGDFGGGGLLLAFGMVCALFEAGRSGKGQVVDAAMLDGATSVMSMFFGFAANGWFDDAPGSHMLGSAAPFYDTYETADGQYISIGSLEPKFFSS
jgi:hypothetical protein